MVIKVMFDCENDFDYIYCPDNISVDKDKIGKLFSEWINNTNEKHPFMYYENGEFIGLCYRGEAFNS